MASDTFQREQQVKADVTESWTVLTDVERLAAWVSVLHEVEEIAPLEHYKAVLQSRVGPLKLRANLDVNVEVLDPGTHVRIRATGRDAQVNSAITIEAALRLEERDGGTLVTTEGSYQVTGRVASMGGGIIRKKAAEVLEEFFSNAQRTLDGAAVGDG